MYNSVECALLFSEICLTYVVCVVCKGFVVCVVAVCLLYVCGFSGPFLVCDLWCMVCVCCVQFECVGLLMCALCMCAVFGVWQCDFCV